MEQNILTSNQQKVLLSAKRDKSITDRFYLTGGTTLSYYYLHHRFSEDFDFFTKEEIDETILKNWVQKTVKEIKASEIEFQELHGQIIYYFHFPKEVIKIDFAYYPFEHVGTFTKDEQLRVSSMLDIGVNKLQALATRQRGRDYVDLYEIIIQGHLPLEELMKNFRIKFDTYIAPEEWGKNFAKILDATDQPRFLGQRNWSDIEAYFLEQAKQYTSQVIREK